MPKNYAQHRQFLFLNYLLNLNPDRKCALKNLKFVQKISFSALSLYAYMCIIWCRLHKEIFLTSPSSLVMRAKSWRFCPSIHLIGNSTEVAAQSALSFKATVLYSHLTSQRNFPKQQSHLSWLKDIFNELFSNGSLLSEIFSRSLNSVWIGKHSLMKMLYCIKLINWNIWLMFQTPERPTSESLKNLGKYLIQQFMKFFFVCKLKCWHNLKSMWSDIPLNLDLYSCGT